LSDWLGSNKQIIIPCLDRNRAQVLRRLPHLLLRPKAQGLNLLILQEYLLQLHLLAWPSYVSPSRVEPLFDRANSALFE
jgi:hypothetical protein